MPDEKEVASFTASTDTGAKLAAAALFIQEEWRAYRHCQLVAVSRLTFVCYLLSSFTSKLVLKNDQTLVSPGNFCCIRCLSCTKVRTCGLQAKIRWLRASRLWREKFHRWMLSIRAKKRLQKEAEAVAVLEERRKQYQANAQQRLAWVEEGLSQRLVEDSTCPVCRSDAGQLHQPCCLAHMILLLSACSNSACTCLSAAQFVRSLRCRHGIIVSHADKSSLGLMLSSHDCVS